MIHVELKILENSNNCTMQFDESMTPDELMAELAGYEEFKIIVSGIESEKIMHPPDDASAGTVNSCDGLFVSMRNERVLDSNKSFAAQGVLGGDTLILI